MTAIRPFLTALAAMLTFFSNSATAQKSGSPDTNVTTVVHDYGTNGASLLLRSDDYNGSGEATYTSSSTRQSSLESWLVNGTDWNLNLLSQSLRTLWITPNSPVGAAPAAPSAGLYWEGVQANTHCFDQFGNLVPLANIVTYSGNCTFGVNFSSGGSTYKLLMSPFPFSEAGSVKPTCPSGGCPSTGLVTVTCASVSGGQCVSWTIAPNSAATNVNVANLYRYQAKGPNATWVFVGQYYNTFLIDVTKP